MRRFNMTEAKLSLVSAPDLSSMRVNSSVRQSWFTEVLRGGGEHGDDKQTYSGKRTL